MKTLEYINIKKPDVEFTAGVLRSLHEYEKLMKNDDIGFISTEWAV